MSGYSHVMDLPEISVTEAEREAFDAILAAHETNEALKHDPVRHPKHYTQGGIECIDAMRAAMTADEFRGYLKGQVIKYAWRMGRKDARAQEAGKLAWYAARLEAFEREIA